MLAQRFWRWVGSSVPPLGAWLYQRWSLQAPSSQWWAFCLRPHLLSPGSLSLPRSLGKIFFFFFSSLKAIIHHLVFEDLEVCISAYLACWGYFLLNLKKNYQQSSEIAVFKKLYLLLISYTVSCFPSVVYLSEVAIPSQLTSSMICLMFYRIEYIYISLWYIMNFWGSCVTLFPSIYVFLFFLQVWEWTSFTHWCKEL